MHSDRETSCYAAPCTAAGLFFLEYYASQSDRREIPVLVDAKECKTPAALLSATLARMQARLRLREHPLATDSKFSARDQATGRALSKG
jgi:hypothetical protein